MDFGHLHQLVQNSFVEFIAPAMMNEITEYLTQAAGTNTLEPVQERLAFHSPRCDHTVCAGRLSKFRDRFLSVLAVPLKSSASRGSKR